MILSDKKQTAKEIMASRCYDGSTFIHTEDVKAFIKELKANVFEQEEGIIDKLAGKELIQ